MLEIGILCCQAEHAKEIERIMKLILAQYGLKYLVRILSSAAEEIEIWSREWRGLSCLVLEWNDREQAFELAEQIWDREPAMQIIYTASRSEDVFAALQMPFFHLVRTFDLEQGLRAAVRKLERMKTFLPEKIDFSSAGGKLLVQRKDILYLESEHHNTRLHLKKGVASVTEGLSQCEEKLKGLGFVRIHRSLLVNMYHIDSLERDSVLLLNKERLYISRYRYGEVRLELERYIRRLEFM